MTRDQITAFCAALPHATHVVQWGGSDVYKIGGKVFAIVSEVEGHGAVSFKTSHLAFEVLGDCPGLRPAPYMASRGLKWIQHFGPPGLGERDLKAHLVASHDMIAQGLSARMRAQMGF